MGDAASDADTIRPDIDEGRILEILEEEREAGPTPLTIGNGNVTNRYHEILLEQGEEGSEDGSLNAAPARQGSPIDSLLSVPDDSPSLQVG